MRHCTFSGIPDPLSMIRSSTLFSVFFVMILIVPLSAEGHVIISAEENVMNVMESNVEMFVKMNAGLVMRKIGITGIWIIIPVKAHAKNVTSVYIANASLSQFVMNAMPAMRKPTNVLVSAILVTNAKNKADVKKNAENAINAKLLMIKESV